MMRLAGELTGCVALMFWCSPLLAADFTNAVSRHDAGGQYIWNTVGVPEESGFSPFGPVDSDVFYISESDPFPPTGGIFSTSAKSRARLWNELFKPDPNRLEILQNARVARNSTVVDVAGTVSMTSIVEFTVPNLTGSALTVTTTWLGDATPTNPGSTGSWSGTASVINVSTNEVLLAFDESSPIQSDVVSMLAADSGDLIRVEFTGRVTASFVTGNWPLDSATVYFKNAFTLQPIPEPGVASLVCLSILIATNKRRRRS